MSRLFRILSPGLLCLTIGFVIGCGGTTEVSQTPSDKLSPSTETTPSIQHPQTKSVAATKTDMGTSPAASASELPPVDALPADVCRRFMELLQSGNRMLAENLLTTAALTTTAKAGLQLEPMGGPTAKYKFVGTKYATIKQSLAHVQFEILEQVDGAAVATDVTWMMRKQNRGWRIAGLLIQDTPDKAQDLLSFENINDVAKIKGIAAGDLAPNNGDAESSLETRQATAPNNQKTLK